MFREACVSSRFSGGPRDLVGEMRHPMDGQLAASECSPTGAMLTIPRSCAAKDTSFSTPHYTTRCEPTVRLRRGPL